MSFHTRARRPVLPTALRTRARALRRRLEREIAARGLPVPARNGRAVERRSLSDAGGSEWFWDHYEYAVEQIVEFCESVGVVFRDRRIADIGCGDGIMAAGLCDRVAPASLVGFDIHPTNREILAARCRDQGIRALPPQLEFRESAETGIPAPDDSFDFVYSWSAFEHISQPVAVLREIHRILRPEGHFFLQLWPFYRSAKGSHLWEWFDDDHHHLKEPVPDILAKLRASDRHRSDWTEYMANEFEHLNRITVDDLQLALAAAGFEVVLVELITARARVTPELATYSWPDLAVGGVKLLAAPTHPAPAAG